MSGGRSRRASAFTQPAFANNDSCEACGTTFSMLANRRTHCRRCGNSFCKRHCSRSHALPKFGITAPTRVCDGCYRHLRVERLMDDFVVNVGGGQLRVRDAGDGLTYAALHSGEGLPEGFDRRDAAVVELQAELSAFAPADLFTQPELAQLPSLNRVRMEQVVRVLSATVRRAPRVDWRAMLQLACVLLGYEDEEPVFWMLQALHTVVRPQAYSLDASEPGPAPWAVDALVCAELVSRFVPDLLAVYETETLAAALTALAEPLFRSAGLDLLPLSAQLAVWERLFVQETADSASLALALALLEIFHAQVVDPMAPGSAALATPQRPRRGSFFRTPSTQGSADTPAGTPISEVSSAVSSLNTSAYDNMPPLSPGTPAPPTVPSNAPFAVRDALASFAATVDASLLRARMEHAASQLRNALPAGGVEALRDEARHRLRADAPAAVRLRQAGIAATLPQAQALVQHLIDSSPVGPIADAEDWLRLAAAGGLESDAADQLWECAASDDWRETVTALACALRGGFLDRLRLVFDAFDERDAGAIPAEAAMEAVDAIVRAGRRGSDMRALEALRSLGGGDVPFVDFYNALRHEDAIVGAFAVPAQRADSLANRSVSSGLGSGSVSVSVGGKSGEATPLLVGSGGGGNGRGGQGGSFLCPCCVVC